MMPTLKPTDTTFVVKMLEDVTIMKWDYSGNFIRLTKDKAYWLPRWIAKDLYTLGLCWYVEQAA